MNPRPLINDLARFYIDALMFNAGIYATIWQVGLEIMFVPDALRPVTRGQLGRGR